MRESEELRKREWKNENLLSENSQSRKTQLNPLKFQGIPKHLERGLPTLEQVTSNHLVNVFFGYWRHECPKRRAESRVTTSDKKEDKDNSSPSFIINSVATLSIKRKFQRNIEFWQNLLKATETILNVMERDYEHPFVETLESCFFANGKSAEKDEQFVSECLAEFLKDKSVIEVDYILNAFNPLSVSMNVPGK